MTHIQALLRKFEALLEAARDKASRVRKPPAHRKTRLHEATAFGPNPGNLRMLVHVPERLPRMAPLVVALHGCSQTADEYDYGTGWSSLANRLGFAVVYPEQQPTNNPKNCFSWFLPGDIARGHGEALSIQQMVEHAIATFGVDRRRVFVTGLSAGGAMAAVMLATYPEVFAGGAIMPDSPMDARGPSNKRSKPCSRNNRIPRRCSEIACARPRNTEGLGRRSPSGTARPIRL